MPDNETKTEERATTVAELKSGLQFKAGHKVVLIVGDRGHAEGDAARTIEGTFRVGDHVLRGASFRLHRFIKDGPLVTPDNLEGGKTGLRWAGDHWVTGDDGKYRISGLPPGKYFVELVGGQSEPGAGK